MRRRHAWLLKACVAAIAADVVTLADAATSCTDVDEYVRWVTTWTNSCTPAAAQTALDPVGKSAAWFGSCSWLTCDCLWGMSAAPVPVGELPACFEVALLQNRIPDDVKWMMTSLTKTCRGVTEAKSAPCGECDKFSLVRNCDGQAVAQPEVEKEAVAFRASGPPRSATSAAPSRALCSSGIFSLLAVVGLTM
eukprot:TRINITY_DN124739_c0_g1_i1.p2 TRINITY_DN124739_c0_g1~~TRINITY_DN124739_c0_g1_i1.p2  ORF type:complete len:193 (+),score=39.25 TRINITY_DN124739_c0_g1_i1:135-713(+)